MKVKFDARANYEKTKQEAGYVNRKEATQETYDRIGFMSGLEVHQQLRTKEKLFCHCPAGKFNKSDDFDAEIIRHMRPTLSELGEYDGTALMEFKTKKEIIYRIKNETACTYEVDDTPPFPLNREALSHAIDISLLSKLNIVGEVHITRKQYLDGSIPTGFQRTAIIGVEGELPLPNKKIRLIQLSIEEDSCREISDIGHQRIYKTDRLGMPLIETVTYPDCVNPDEVKETCNYIRFLNRSTGKVRTGIGAGRQDVNVSCKGGTRIEIKGVAHTNWIPELTHNEAFRQWSLLLLRDQLNQVISDKENWHVQTAGIDPNQLASTFEALNKAIEKGEALRIVRLPKFKGALSHFTQPEMTFANEISDRLKVIACIEKPNMIHTEMFEPALNEQQWATLGKLVDAEESDALILVFGPIEDMETAIETIEERCKMALEGIPEETRKSFENGTTIFERVLPGADRMYPDTDSAPIPLAIDYIESKRKNLPEDIIERYNKLKKWGAPEDTYTYIFSKNYFPVIREIHEKLGVDGKLLAVFVGQRVKHLLGQNPGATLSDKTIFDLFEFLKSENIDYRLAWQMLPDLIAQPERRFDEILKAINFSKIPKEELEKKIADLAANYKPVKKTNQMQNKQNWIMGQLRKEAVGNVDMKQLATKINAI
ncbi:MAG: Glu-tRNA(Gln) amidotransferase subunit GatE [Lentimicrobiaceae bacterium]|jgi:glutamyl-tRNA(Gln) amidotransferase subunit E|nr:Glu-tRNA(Gln) amidotransferase subunit GatE [Lentimicrobiaceae bacterium]